MKRLKIRNFGPLSQADISLREKNLIVGLQSSGKSCVLKTACYCTWVEKRIELAQSASEFQEGSHFLDLLADYHEMKDFICDDTFIEYETGSMKFSYSNSQMMFSFDWKQDRWKYRRPKISYIPSGRNLVAAIPAWSKLELSNDNLLDFMTDWNAARMALKHVDNVLDLGLSYRYDASSNTDSIVLPSGKVIRLSEGSSGVQSLLPLFVHLNYLFEQKTGQGQKQTMNYEQKEEEKRLLQLIAEHLNKEGKVSSVKDKVVIASKGGMSFFFGNQRQANQFVKLASGYLQPDFNEIFLEEPENNLFPPTQSRLIDWLLEKTSQQQRTDRLFVATHSPYVLNQFLKNSDKSFRLFITHPDKKGKFTVTALSDSEVQEVYDNGVDLFFNFEAYL